MKLGLARRAEIIRLQGIGCTSEIFQIVAGFQTRESEMRRKSARFASEAERLESLLHCSGEFCEIGSGLHAAPEHTRLEFIGEETEHAKIHGDGLRRANRR